MCFVNKLIYQNLYKRKQKTMDLARKMKLRKVRKESREVMERNPLFLLGEFAVWMGENDQLVHTMFAVDTTEEPYQGHWIKTGDNVLMLCFIRKPIGFFGFF